MVIQYSYDGLAGATAHILPVIEKKSQKGVSAWFGANAQTVGAGRGTVSIKVRYFVDEEGVPSELTTDRIKVLILNQTGNVVLYSETQGKKIQWGHLTDDKSKTAETVKNVDRDESTKPSQSTPGDKTKKPEKDTSTSSKSTATSKPISPAEAPLKTATTPEAIQTHTTKAKSEPASVEQPSEKVPPVQKTAAPIIQPVPVEPSTAPAQLKEELKQEKNKGLETILPRPTTVETNKAPAAQGEPLKAQDRTQTMVNKEESGKELAKVIPSPAATAARADSMVKNEEEPVAMTKVSPGTLKTRITNLDVVNRSLDRSKATVGVEFEYMDDLSDPVMGVYVSRTGDAKSPNFFKTAPVGIGKSRRNFILVPVSFDTQAARLAEGEVYYSDRMTVFIEETVKRRRYELFTATMLLKWSASGTSGSGLPANPTTLEMDDLKQINPGAGYVTIRYNHPSGASVLHVKIYSSSNPATADLLTIEDQKVPAGRNLQLVEYALKPDARIPSDGLKMDTLEIELRDETGKVISQLRKEISITLTRP